MSTGIIKKYQESIRDDYSIVEHANSGMDSDLFFELIELTGLERDYVAENIFDVSLKTLMRYRKDDKKLSPHQSEIALKLVKLYRKGIEVFTTSESFTNWLRKPALGLNNLPPLQFLNTSTGIDLVEDELIRIEFGALA